MVDKPKHTRESTVDEVAQVEKMVKADPVVFQLFEKLPIPVRFAAFFNRKFVVWKVRKDKSPEILAVPVVTDIEASIVAGIRVRLKDVDNGIDQWAVHTPRPLGPYPLLIWVPHEQTMVWREKVKNGKIDYDLTFSLVSRQPSNPARFRNPGKTYMAELNNFKSYYSEFADVNL